MKNLTRSFVSSCLLIPLINFSHAEPSIHAPISVMGDHMHKKGEWMLDYRYMRMTMDELYEGNNEVSRKELYQRGYMELPTHMTMEMHMFGLMYAPTDDINLMVMVPYLRNDMSHQFLVKNHNMEEENEMEEEHDDMHEHHDPLEHMHTHGMSMENDGMGDISLTVLYRLFDVPGQHVHANLGLSFPTGSIDEHGTNHHGERVKLSYEMQLGSGTFDLLPGITYTGHTTSGSLYSWGTQAQAVVRLGKNDNGYRLGNRYELHGWFAKHWTDFLATSIRLSASHTDKIHGDDNDLRKMADMMPTADADNYGGNRITAGIGMNVTAPYRNTLALEYAKPIYQDLNGPQMAIDWQFTAGWQWTF